LRQFRQLVSFPGLVFGFYALILLIPDAYDVFGAALVLLSIGVIASVRPRMFQGLDRWFAFFLALYPLSLLPSLVVKGGTFDYLDYPIRCLLFIPLIMGLRAHAERESFEKALFIGASAGGVGAGLFSLKGLLLDHVGRVGLPLTNPIPYGQIAAILAILSLASFFRFDGVWRRCLAVMGFLGAVYGVYGSGSAGALLGMALGLVVEGVVLLRARASRTLVYGLIGFGVAAITLVMPLASAKLVQVLSDLHAFSLGQGMGTSQGQRLVLWGMSLREIAHSPWFGIGPGHFDGVMDRFCLTHVCTEAFSGFHGVHNQYLDSFMNGGIVSLVGLLASFLLPLGLFFKRAVQIVEGAQIPAIAGVAVIVAAMTSAIPQVLYGHNISVISYFFTITFLWYGATASSGQASLFQSVEEDR
jgi:O-antigen ligase